MVIERVIDTLAVWFCKQFAKEDCRILLLIPLAGLIGVGVCMWEECVGGRDVKSKRV